jgi:7-cyano-7-deazaguanine tRNA-ribosyltransferase
MLVVAGTSLKQLEPRVWDPVSPYYLPNLRAVMVSFAELSKAKAFREKATKNGLRAALGAPETVEVYLDNGAFSSIRSGTKPNARAFWDFVRKAKPDWYPIPADFIPLPSMTESEQYTCYKRTMYYNRQYSFDGCVPIVHAGIKLEQYLKAFASSPALSGKKALAIGGLVPQLLQTKGTGPKSRAIDSILLVRRQFPGQIHVFGIGGTATLHLAAILELDSADSSGWRNRAARGIIQLPGRGDRLLTQFGTWRGRALDDSERDILAACQCPGCREAGIVGLAASGTAGFCRRATHNLYVLLSELEEVERRLADQSYAQWYPTHVFNGTFLNLIGYALKQKEAGPIITGAHGHSRIVRRNSRSPNGTRKPI